MSVPSLLSIFGNSGGEDPLYVDDVFSTFLWTGTGNTNLTINNGIDLDGEGGLVWLKQRSSPGEAHTWNDTERGQTKVIMSNYTYGNFTSGATQDLTSFNSNGFSLGPNYNYVKNELNKENVSWTFRKAPGFFDVVTWSGTNTNRNIAHNLGSVPGMVIVKRTDAGDAWYVYHRSTGATKYLELNLTGNGHTSSATWNNTAPTSSVFTVGSFLNATGGTYVAYVFAHDEPVFGTDEDESIIKCGTFTGNTTVNLGFEPQWILIKPTSSTGDWDIHDSMRGWPSFGDAKRLRANKSDAESETSQIFPNATGFSTLIGSATYIYMAIRRSNKPPESATEVFAMDTGSTSSTTPTFDSGFVVDAALEDNYLHARLCGAQSMFTYVARVNQADTLSTWDSNLGWAKSYNSSTLSYMFRRAPGFFDVVTYTGNNSSVQNIPHNLTVKPEAMLIKCKELNLNWTWYDAASSATKNMAIPDDGPAGTSSGSWNDTEPTSSVFTVGTNNTAVNSDGETHIAFLFATLPGISKVGSYTGTGNAINVDCGFTNGARFILIKRSNGANPAGDWYYWDTFNGIVGGNDSYNRLNLAPSRVTGTDYIDPLSTGFTVTSSAPAALNVTGSTYVFLAIA